jgi:hypothetical protein
LLVPNILQQLISLVQLLTTSLSIHRYGNSFRVSNGHSNLFAGQIKDNLLHVHASTPVALAAVKHNIGSVLWHQRLGHRGTIL